MKTAFVTLGIVFAAVAGMVVYKEANRDSTAISAARGGSTAKVATISHGEDFSPGDHLAAGQITLFEFGADW
ncbi:MAG: hypothetical protein AB7I19_20005 [Planctomycetota bacterium]